MPMCRFFEICLHGVLRAFWIFNLMCVIELLSRYENISNISSFPFFVSSPFGIPITCILQLLKLAVLRYSVLVFFILLSLCFSVWEVSIGLSANSRTVSLAQFSLLIRGKGGETFPSPTVTWGYNGYIISTWIKNALQLWMKAVSGWLFVSFLTARSIMNPLFSSLTNF